MHCFTEADYGQQRVSVVINPGTVVQQFSISINNDNIVECTETFTLSISTEGIWCGLNTSHSIAQVIIIDNDGKISSNTFSITFTV